MYTSMFFRCLPKVIFELGSFKLASMKTGIFGGEVLDSLDLLGRSIPRLDPFDGVKMLSPHAFFHPAPAVGNERAVGRFNWRMPGNVTVGY